MHTNHSLALYFWPEGKKKWMVCNAWIFISMRTLIHSPNIHNYSIQRESSKKNSNEQKETKQKNQNRNPATFHTLECSDNDNNSNNYKKKTLCGPCAWTQMISAAYEDKRRVLWTVSYFRLQFIQNFCCCCCFFKYEWFLLGLLFVICLWFFCCCFCCLNAHCHCAK